MALTNAEKQKRWRDRQKEKNAEEYRRKERERKRLKYVPINELSAEKRAKERKKGKEKYRRKCERKANLKRQLEMMNDQPESSFKTLRSNSSSEKLVLKLPVWNKRSGRSTGVKKRYENALKHAHRVILKLKEENREKERQKKRVQKRIERERKKRESRDSQQPPIADENNNSLTPRSKTKFLLKKAGVDIGKRNPVFKQLLLGESVINSLKQNIEKKKKMSSNRKISLELLKKYRCINLLSTNIGVGRKLLANLHVKRVNKSLRERYGQAIVNFMEREDNSTVMPGKRDTKSTGDGIQQKRILNDYLHNLYEKFRLENPSVQLSKTTFLRMRPKHILYSCFSSRKTCLCTYHQNFALKLKAMKNVGLLVSGNPDVFIKTYETNDSVKVLLEQGITENNIKYKHWKKVLDNEKYRWKELEENVTKQQFVEEVITELSSFRQHVLRVQTQYREMRRLRENLPENEILLWMDFAENYSCTNMEEVQSAYWNTDMVSLHTMVAYLPGGKIQSFVAVSSSLQHNATVVYCILLKIIPLIRQLLPGLVKIHYLTDSPTSQYRNKTIFKLICEHAKEFDGVSAQWNYLEVGHGKGPCDGLGASVKRAADMAVKQEKSSIQDANEFFTWASENNSSKIRYVLYSERDIELAKSRLEKYQTLVSIPGTMKIHAVAPLDEHSVAVRETSCYCVNCLLGIDNSKCSGWETKVISKTLVTEGSNLTMTQNIPKATEQEQQVNENPVGVEKGEWVAAIYDGEWYIGQVTSYDKKDYRVNFLTSAGKYQESYKFPNSRDEIWLDKHDVVAKVKTLKPVGKSKRCYKIDANEKDEIESKVKVKLTCK